jgi:S-layer protein
MATSDTIKQFFQNILQRQPTAAELSSQVAAVDSGARSLTQARDDLAAGTEAVTFVDQVIRIYQAAFGRVPDITGITGWVNELRSDATALSRVSAGFVNSQEWKNRYGDNSVSDVSLGALYQNVLGRAGSAQEIAAWKATGQPMTQILIGFSNSAEFQNASAGAVLGLKKAAGDVSPANLASVYNGTSALTLDLGGSQIVLTRVADPVVGTSGADKISGVVDGTADQTFGGLDTIDGGQGNDTLTLTNSTASGLMALQPASVKNVETLVLRSTSSGATTADVQTWTGLETVTVEHQGNAPLTLTSNGNVRSVTVTGGGSVTLDDKAGAGADKLASVSLNGVRGATTITSDALTDLSLANQRVTDASTPINVVVKGAGKALTVSVNNLLNVRVFDEETTAVTLNATGAASSLNGSFLRAESLTIAADEAVTFDPVVLFTLRTLTITGDSKVNILEDPAFLAPGLTTLNAAANSGGVSVTDSLANAVVTGGSGADQINLAAAFTKTASLGGGNDQLSAFGNSFASLDGGTGTDTVTLSMGSANSTGTMSKVSGFEVLKIFNDTTFAGQVVDVGAMNSGGRNAIQTIEFQGAINHNTTVAGLGSGGSLQFSAPNTGTVTVAVAGAATGTSDSINLALKGNGGTFNAGGNVILSDVETVNITVDRPSSAVTQLDLSASAARSITVSGTGSLTFMDFQNDVTQFNGPALTSMDASGLTGAIRFSLKNAVSAPVTLKGGSGNDELAAASAQAAVTIDGGGGNDSIVGGKKADTLSGGSGNDFIITGTGADIVDVGSGFDTVQLSVNNDSRANFVTVSGMGAGDKLDFANNGTSVASFVATKVSLAAGASFAAHLDAATTGGVNRVTWFQFEGNTYAVHDRTSFAGFSNGADQFVKLVGLIDLGGSTFSNDADVVLTL